MRLDLFLATLGIIKRRTEAKEKSENGLVSVNGRVVKPAYEVRIGDIIAIGGADPRALEVLKLPHGSVRKDLRGEYTRALPVAGSR